MSREVSLVRAGQRMVIAEQVYHCIACRHEWIGETISNCPIEVWTAHIKSLRCPKCGAGSRKIGLGRGHVPNPDPIVRAGLTDAERRLLWARTYDCGLSSQCIADLMCGETPARIEWPRDADDFGRCERLMMRFPEWRARMPDVALLSPEWAALVARWDEIKAAWLADTARWEKLGRRNRVWTCGPLMRVILEGVGKQD